MKVSDAALDRLSALIAEDNAPLGLILDDRYEMRARLAKGGMGDVFIAVDRRLRRDVAVKILSGALSSPEWTARFRAEALTMSSIDHPGVVPIHDLGVLPDGRAWYAMKYIGGSTLDALEADLKTRVRHLAHAAAVVQHAHDRGIIHRDLKPLNLMVGPNEQVYVLDWGIAKVRDEFRLAIEEEVDVPSGATGAGAVMGTLEYMPPEQALGKAIDARSDVYGLGAVLYELLTGRPPVRGPKETALLLKARAGIVKPPRQRRPDVPSDLDAICMKALARDPAARYPSARAFGEDVRRWLEGDPVEARRPSIFRRAWTWTLRHKAAAVAALAVVTAGLVWIATRGDASVASAKRLEDDVFGPIRARIERLPRTPEGWTRARDLIDEGLRVHGASWSAWLLKASVEENLGQTEAATAAYARVIELNPKVGIAYYRRGTIHFEDRRDVESALKDFEEALRLEPENEYALVGRARVLGMRGDFPGAFRLCDEAERKGRHVVDLYMLRGWLHAPLDRRPGGDFGKSIDAYTRALELNPRHWLALSHRGNARLESGDVKGALADHEAALALRQDRFELWGNRGIARSRAGDHAGAIADQSKVVELKPEQPRGWFNRGVAKQDAGDPKGAFADFSQALELRPDYSKALLNRGNLLRDLGRLDDALRDYDRAIAAAPDDGALYSARGFVLHELKRLDAAFADFERAIALNPKDVEAWANRGVAKLDKGDLKGAVADWTKALELGAAKPELFLNRAQIRAELEDFDGALADYDEVLRRTPDDGLTLGERGTIHLIKKNVEQALKDYSRAIDLAPDVASPWINRGRIRADRGDLEGAVSDLTQGLKRMEPGSPRRAEVQGRIDALKEKLRKP